MKSTTICLALLVGLTVSNRVHGQLFKNLFGGDTNQSQPLGYEPSALGSLNESTEQQKFRLPTLPSLFKQQDPQSDVLGRGDMSGLSNLVPTPRLPAFNQSNLLDQFNSKSKQMIDRTTDWARDKQQRLKEKTFGRLGATNPLGFLSGSAPPSTREERTTPMKPGPTGNRSIERTTNSELAQPSTITPRKPDYFAPPKVIQPAQPPIRTASSPDGQPAMRF